MLIPKSSSTPRRHFLKSLALSPLALHAAEPISTNQPAATEPDTETEGEEPTAPKIVNLNKTLESIRANNRCPALAAAVIADGKLSGVGLVGIRKGGSPIPVQRGDLWHIGSCAKAMTATLIAYYVEKKKIGWGNRIADTIPELRDSITPAFRDVTLEQLLTHRSGLSNQPPSDVWDEAWAQRGTPTQQRFDFARANLAREPEAPPGSKYIYSNQGYTIATLMLERQLDKPYETLMREDLFKPLAMRLVGFGVPGTLGQIDQPWGHKWRANRLDPVQLDNPPAVAPAGGIHCSIWDFIRFAAFHLQGARGEGRILKPETFSILHSPPNGAATPYAMGWMRGRAEWADNGFTLTHTGSNTLNFAEMWIAPKINFAAVAVTNIGETMGERATAQTIEALTKRFGKQNPAPAKKSRPVA